MIDALMPRDPARYARRVGTIAIVLAAFVAFLFPESSRAGTETPIARGITAGALLLAGLTFRIGARGLLLVLVGFVLLAAGAALAPAPWLAAFGGLAALYVAGGRLRRAGDLESGAPAIAAAHDHAGSGESAPELVESLAMALVLALVVREFAFEAFKIPTGSMEPTIHGDAGKRKGDRLLANKWLAEFQDPPRWSIVVFRFPLFRPTNFIKRLVGLPGERLEIRDGDIYVNGRVEPKPDAVQETLWFPEFPGEAGREALETVFRGDAGWSMDSGGGTGKAASGEEKWIRTTRGLANDLRISFDVDGSSIGEGAVLAEVEGGGRRVVLEARSGELKVSAPGMDPVRLDKGLPQRRVRLSLAVADRVVRVAVDGTQVMRFAHPDERNVEGREGRAGIGVSGAQVEIGDVRIEHDLQYRRDGAGVWTVPEGRFFMLGDNTGSSQDSRVWQAYVLRMRDGRELVAPARARLDDDDRDSTPNFRTLPDDSGWEFHDSYGVPRRVLRDEVVADPIEEAQPYVKREDIVGRAFLIFFPFPPLGEFRPRFLP